MPPSGLGLNKTCFPGRAIVWRFHWSLSDEFHTSIGVFIEFSFWFIIENPLSDVFPCVKEISLLVGFLTIREWSALFLLFKYSEFSITQILASPAVGSVCQSLLKN